MQIRSESHAITVFSVVQNSMALALAAVFFDANGRYNI